MEELKSCPFCENKMQIATSKCITADGPKTGYHGYCAGCGMHTQTRFSEEEAIADVNRRAEPENKPLTLKELKQMRGQPVYTMCPQTEIGHYAVISMYLHNAVFFTDGTYEHYETYGEEWIAYAHKPKGE